MDFAGVSRRVYKGFRGVSMGTVRLENLEQFMYKWCILVEFDHSFLFVSQIFSKNFRMLLTVL